jgi:hypothetical protein
MGTASQSLPSGTQRDEFDALVRDAVGRSSKRKGQLNKKIGEVINALLNDSAILAGVRPTLRNAINNEVRRHVSTKLREWIANGKKPSEWPFKDIEL